MRLALIAAIVCVAGVARADVITEIEVRENSKTSDKTVIQISKIELGSEWTPELGERARSELISSGLFKEIIVAPEPGTNGVRVVIVAKDKHSWVVAPTFYDQPTNRGGGVGFGENNLFGENKKLLLYAQYATGDSFFVGAYVDPAIRGSRWHWQYDVYLRSSRIFEYEAPDRYRDDPRPLRTSRLQYLNTGINGGFSIGDVSLDMRFRGAHVSYSDVGLAEGASIEDVGGLPGDEVLPPGEKGWDITTVGTVTYDTRSNYFGVTRGNKIQLTIEQAFPISDFDYWEATFGIRHAHVFFERHNLDLRLSGSYGQRMPFQAETSAGGTNLRGYLNDQFRGNMKVASTTEYSVPVFNIKGFGVRALGFVDAAYCTFHSLDAAYRNYLPDADAGGVAPLKTSIGVGTRLYLRQIVLPLLGIDLGYGLERNAFEVYLAVGLTDV
jgi:outer membrane protein insertion porin family